MRLRPGSPLWLLRHELRLGWRGVAGGFPVWLTVGAFFWVILHAVSYRVMGRFSLELLTGPAIVVPGIVVWIGLTLILSGAVVLAVNALFDRGDLDLLISSPLPTHTVFAARGVGVAVSAMAFPALLLLPFAHMGIVRGQWGLIAAYPVVAAIGLGVAAIAFAITLQLVRWIGARRARVVAQILSGLIGASLFLGFQAFNFASRGNEEEQLATFMQFLSSPWLAPDSPLWWPVRALLGDPLPALATVAAGTGLFIFVIGATSKAFVAGTQQSLAGRARRVRATGVTRFERGLMRNVVRKELRLIARDPNLIANSLLQCLYMAPLLFIMARSGDVTLLLGPTAIVILASLAGNLAWITISGEEAPDLIGSAPVNRDGMRWLKAGAALLPLAALGLPLVLFYLIRSPLAAPVFALFLGLGLLSSAVIQVWGGKPSPHRDIRLRQKQNVGLNFVEVLGTMAIAGACFLTMRGSWWAAVVLPLGLIAPLIAWTARRRE